MKKVVLAYSGGLDTSVILKWIKETYQCEVATFTADLGQDEDFDQVVKNAEMTGADDVVVVDCRREFVTDYIFPSIGGNAVRLMGLASISSNSELHFSCSES